MRYALSLPNFGVFRDPTLVVDLARDAETAGWNGFFVWDHLLGWDGNEVADPWILLAAIAVATERVRIGPMVTPLPRRRPWQVARQIVTLDHLSGGRAVLGVGLGYPPHEEFGVFGEPEDVATRAAILDEALEIVAGLMTGEPFGYEGRRFRLEEVTFAPRPVQRPRVPIWVAGAWPNHAPFRRAARFDGVTPITVGDEQGPGIPTVDQMREIVSFVDAEREATGRADAGFDAVYTGWMPADRTEAAAIAEDLGSFGVTWWQVSPGWPDEPLEDFRDFVRAGPPG